MRSCSQNQINIFVILNGRSGVKNLVALESEILRSAQNDK